MVALQNKYMVLNFFSYFGNKKLCVASKKVVWEFLCGSRSE